MRGSLLWKFMYLFCAMAGVLAGYGIFTLTSTKENNERTKDNTLVREAGDSVFFDEEKEDDLSPAPTFTSTFTSTFTPTPTLSPAPSPTLSPMPIKPYVPTPTEVVSAVIQLPVEQEVAAPIPTEEATATPMATPTMKPLPSPADVLPDEPLPTNEPEVSIEEVFTYPAQIFGQVPVINRSDAYVSYFEFAYDLISMMEPVVSARGLNLNSLLTKFVIKALFCGIDIEKLDINAPIPRRLAALCLWLAAQVLNENGCETSSKSAAGYVTDIAGCSSSERKAIAYLYESGILKGYQVSGQRFFPEEGLKTETGTTWLSAVKHRWK